MDNPSKARREVRKVVRKFVDLLKPTGFYPDLDDRGENETDEEAKNRQDAAKDRILAMERSAFREDICAKHDAMVAAADRYAERVAKCRGRLKRLDKKKTVAEGKKADYEAGNKSAESIARCEKALREIEDEIRNKTKSKEEYMRMFSSGNPDLDAYARKNLDSLINNIDYLLDSCGDLSAVSDIISAGR